MGSASFELGTKQVVSLQEALSVITLEKPSGDIAHSPPTSLSVMVGSGSAYVHGSRPDCCFRGDSQTLGTYKWPAGQ